MLAVRCNTMRDVGIIEKSLFSTPSFKLNIYKVTKKQRDRETKKETTFPITIYYLLYFAYMASSLSIRYCRSKARDRNLCEMAFFVALGISA